MISGERLHKVLKAGLESQLQLKSVSPALTQLSVDVAFCHGATDCVQTSTPAGYISPRICKLSTVGGAIHVTYLSYLLKGLNNVEPGEHRALVVCRSTSIKLS